MELGIQQMKNATTIATVILSTFLFLLVLCSSALADSWMGLLFKLDQNDGVKYHQDDKRDVEEQDRS